MEVPRNYSLTIAALVLAINFISDGLRDMLDPRTEILTEGPEQLGAFS